MLEQRKLNFFSEKIFRNQIPVCTKCGKSAYVKPGMLFLDILRDSYSTTFFIE